VRLQIGEATKAFGDTKALDGVDLVAAAGEIHAIVGENGSGKSTLVKLVGGILTQDSGTVLVDGEPVRHASPRRMAARGVAVVYQEVLTVGSGTVVDNVYLGGDSLLRSTLDRGAKAARAKELLERLSERPIDPFAEVEGLPLSVRQWIAVARALVREPNILILDESTAALDLADAARLVGELERLKEEGVCVLLVTHRLAELQRLADRATVLRDGRTVATLERGELNEQRLVELMTGEALEALEAAGEERRHSQPGRVTVRVDDLVLREGAAGISADIRAGEVVGLAGLDGEGHATFVRVLAGIEDAVDGTVTSLGDDGSTATIGNEAEAARNGIVYVPGDRKSEGILPNQTILENFGLPSYRDHSRLGLVSRRSVRRSLKEAAAPLRLNDSRARDLITSLSGGNQQKVIIARWLARQPRVILLNDPTRGVDMITKKDLYLTLRDLAAEGATVLFLSTEVEELTALCDRIFVFRGQTVAGELSGECEPREVVAGMFGVERPQEVEEVVAEAGAGERRVGDE
jgi:ribose transport system ATP-binding protein